jgi:hypothetical protein
LTAWAHHDTNSLRRRRRQWTAIGESHEDQ